jgi:Uma2 family endonuclease
MAAPKGTPRLTVDQYLAMERHSLVRHEYVDGFIWAMAGESDTHGIISVNLVITLGTQLKGKPCQVRSKDLKVRSGPTPKSPGRDLSGLYSYPDVVVVCDEPVYHDDYRDVLLNPAVIIEVLSPATEEFDRGEKCIRYRDWNPTLEAYLLVSQDRPQVEIYTRQDPTNWGQHMHTGLQSTVPLPTIGCTLVLTDIYDRVVFPVA